MQQESVTKNAFHLVFVQVVAIILFALISWLIKGLNSGLSTLLGGLAYTIPNLCFVWRLFSQQGARMMKKIVLTFFFGEAAKLLVSALLLGLIVKYLPVNVLSALLGFIGAILSFWVISAYYLASTEREI